jgi:hypothetical protein
MADSAGQAPAILALVTLTAQEEMAGNERGLAAAVVLEALAADLL